MNPKRLKAFDVRDCNEENTLMAVRTGNAVVAFIVTALKVSSRVSCELKASLAVKNQTQTYIKFISWLQDSPYVAF